MNSLKFFLFLLTMNIEVKTGAKIEQKMDLFLAKGCDRKKNYIISEGECMAEISSGKSACTEFDLEKVLHVNSISVKTAAHKTRGWYVLSLVDDKNVVRKCQKSSCSGMAKAFKIKWSSMEICRIVVSLEKDEVTTTNMTNEVTTTHVTNEVTTTHVTIKTFTPSITETTTSVPLPGPFKKLIDYLYSKYVDLPTYVVWMILFILVFIILLLVIFIISMIYKETFFVDDAPLPKEKNDNSKMKKKIKMEYHKMQDAIKTKRNMKIEQVDKMMDIKYKQVKKVENETTEENKRELLKSQFGQTYATDSPKENEKELLKAHISQSNENKTLKETEKVNTVNNGQNVLNKETLRQKKKYSQNLRKKSFIPISLKPIPKSNNISEDISDKETVRKTLKSKIARKASKNFIQNIEPGSESSTEDYRPNKIVKEAKSPEMQKRK